MSASGPPSETHVCLNGRMVRSDRARIAHDDAGFQHAVGLFETMAARHGRVFRLEAHLARLIRSADELGIAARPDAAQLRGAVERTIEHNRLEQARVRLTVTAGRLSLLQSTVRKPPPPTSLVVTTPPTPYDPSRFEQGITVTVTPAAANPFDPTCGHKTLAYWHRLHSLRQAAEVGADESIWLTTSNHLASGAVSNVFLARDGKLQTPIAHGEEIAGALRSPVLPGITRAALIDIAESMNIGVERRTLDINQLLEADEIFLTNSSWHLLPVTRVEKKTVGDGKPGEMCRRLRSALLELIEQETRTVAGKSNGDVGY